MARTRHVIVGGGTAGMNAITTIRQYDGGASEIILVSSERPYARTVLPYYLKFYFMSINIEGIIVLDCTLFLNYSLLNRSLSFHKVCRYDYDIYFK
ncbi:MAG: FAD/NAD(P)-binding oxidoreductase [bacterium]|nr:FAD/NAD(P)-binding oxidoreductase [bacterium]